MPHASVTSPDEDLSSESLRGRDALTTRALTATVGIQQPTPSRLFSDKTSRRLESWRRQEIPSRVG